ncbi:MAG: toll/interleukin-1 receptor domain-containing protein [Pseudomonadota bacterium]
MADIFISYKREDQEEHGRVRPIAEALRAEGYDVFYDVQVPPGSSWEDVLQSKINAARAVIVLWSAHSVGSDWVKEEAEMAKHAGKLIPVFLDAVPPPFGFARIEGANLVDWDGDLTHIEWKNLVAAIKTRIGDGEKDIQPGLTRVAYQPAKTVTVTKAAPKKGGGGVLKALAAVVALAVVGGLGLVGYSLVQQNGMLKNQAEDAALDAAMTRSIDERAWADAKTADTIEAYEKYLSLRATGAYRADAVARIEELKAEAEERPAPANEGTVTAVANPAIRDAVAGRQLTAETPETVQISPAVREAIVSNSLVGLAVDLGESCRDYGTDWEVRQEQGRWKLWGSNRRTVIEFPNQAEAERGVEILQKLGVNNYCTVGAEFRYFKAGNALPTGALGNEDCTTIQRDRLGYKVAGGRHLVINGDASMIAMRTETEAQKALTILRGLGAAELCYLGRPGPSLTYLKR